MAEFVAQSLGIIKKELEPVKFLTIDEKKKILKKRERFEYRIRKRTKEEKDYLLYIQYEKDVLTFFKIRKRVRGVKSRDEVPIIKRIHQLYQLCETRFPQSRDLWLQHIDFCKQQKEFSRVGRLFAQMLRTHSTEPELWVQAARWELEQSNTEDARTLMQRCVSVNKTSLMAWVEFYRLELEIAQSMRGNNEEIEESDPSKNGAIANLVSKHACQQCPDSFELLLSLIQASEKFRFAGLQRKKMLQQLRERFGEVPRVWDFLARRCLPSKTAKLRRLQERQEERFFEVYEEAVTEIPTSEMWTLYLKGSMELLSAPTADSERLHKRMERVLQIFQRAADHDCLSVEMFLQWLAMLQAGEEAQRVGEVCELMVRRFPHSAQSWVKRVQHQALCLADPAEVVACLNKALEAVPEEETWGVWEPALLYLSSVSYQHLQSLMEKSCHTFCRDVAVPAKLFYLQWTAVHKGIDDVRAMFDKWYKHKPVSLDFYLHYIQEELMEDKVRMDLVRRAFEYAISDYGKTEPDLWLRYMEVETEYGQPSLSGDIGTRAMVNLPPGPLRDYYTLRHSGLPA